MSAASGTNLYPTPLTVTRIFLVPLLVVVLLTKFEGEAIFGIQKEFVAAAIFALASFTDWLDGYLARRRQQVTALGQMIDPIADKLLTSAAFISLVQLNLAPAWMVAVIIGRELAVTGLNFNHFYLGGLHSAYVRGEAYMAGRQYPEAAIEFQKVLGHRGLVGLDPIGALAHLQLARVFALSKETAKAKASYETFLSMWKDADSDLPQLKQAKAEYARLQ